MLKVFGGFVISLVSCWLVTAHFLLLSAGLEILVAFLQVYVFAILTCIYLNDALNHITNNKKGENMQLEAAKMIGAGLGHCMLVLVLVSD